MNCQAVIYSKVMEDGAEWVRKGQTEIAHDVTDHKFVKSQILDYSFEQQQRIRVEVYNVKSAGKDLSEQEFIGAAECYIAEVVASTSTIFELPLEHFGKKKDKDRGAIRLVAEELNELKYDVSFTMKGRDLLKMNFLQGNADPYVAESGRL